MLALRRLEPKRRANAPNGVRRWANVTRLLEPRVPFGADISERGHLLAPQPRRAPSHAARQADVLRLQAHSTDTQEGGDLTAPVVAQHLKASFLSEGGTLDTRMNRSLSRFRVNPTMVLAAGHAPRPGNQEVDNAEAQTGHQRPGSLHVRARLHGHERLLRPGRGCPIDRGDLPRARHGDQLLR